MTAKYITPELFEHLEKQQTKTAKKILAYLNFDILEVLQDGNAFWYEMNRYTNKVPKYVHAYVKRWCKDRQAVYLYDIKSNY